MLTLNLSLVFFQSEGADDGDDDDDEYDDNEDDNEDDDDEGDDEDDDDDDYDAACMTCEMAATQERLATLARALISPFWFFCVTAISNLSPNINLDMANTSI